MTRTRLAWMYLVASALIIGCQPTPSQPDAGQEDAGVAWDGTATPLEELGDLLDTGRLSVCGIITDGGVSESCGDLGTFDLSRCNRASLANVTPGGHYNQTLRTEANGTRLGGNVIFSGDGGTGLLNGKPLTDLSQDERTLLFSERVALSDGGTLRRSYAACESPGGSDFTGCYATCTNGRVTGRGSTFRATRLTWRAGESESSGLQLVSERRVDLGWPVDVYVTREHAYVVSIDNENGGGTGGLSVFNVSNKSAPVLEKVVTLGNDSYWNGVWAKGDALYVASKSARQGPRRPHRLRRRGPAVLRHQQHRGRTHLRHLDAHRPIPAQHVSGAQHPPLSLPARPVRPERAALHRPRLRGLRRGRCEQPE